jgi:hypothetical protein
MVAMLRMYSFNFDSISSNSCVRIQPSCVRVYQCWNIGDRHGSISDINRLLAADKRSARSGY